MGYPYGSTTECIQQSEIVLLVHQRSMKRSMKQAKQVVFPNMLKQQRLSRVTAPYKRMNVLLRVLMLDQESHVMG